MRVKSDARLTYSKKGTKHSYTITPEMGVVKHFPRHVVEGLIEMGAELVPLTPPAKSAD